jgi:hypothetical protein
MTAVITITLLLAAWTAAWLNWLFNGEIRQFLASWLFPGHWLGSRSRAAIAHMDNEEFMIFLCTSPGIPEFFRGVLTCPMCLSAHITGVGTLLVCRPIYTLSGGYWELIPLVWAAAAVIGYTCIQKKL